MRMPRFVSPVPCALGLSLFFAHSVSAQSALVAAYRLQRNERRRSDGWMPPALAIRAPFRAATRTSAGRFGNVLSFDGINDWITIADSPSLDLAIAMTIECGSVQPVEARTAQFVRQQLSAERRDIVDRTDRE
jgi:hypothetical protein